MKPVYLLQNSDNHFYTLCPEKKDRQYFEHNFDKLKYTVLIFCEEYHEGNAKLLTQQKSTSPNQCCYFTLRIRQWPCIAKRRVITTPAIKPNRPSYFRASVRLSNDSN